MINLQNKENIVFYIFLLIIFILSVIFILYIYTQNKNINEITSVENNNTNNDIYENNINTDDKKIDIYIPKILATFTTKLHDKDTNRINNITLGLERINYVIVKKGEIFSINKHLLSLGPQNGYLEATSLDGKGKKKKSYAGGVCQISSTLYNACLLTNMEIKERHPHSARVPYVPQNKDASVSLNADFKFKNTYTTDIKIISSKTDNDITISIEEVL